MIIVVLKFYVLFIDVDDDFDPDAGFAKTPTDDRWEGEDEDLKEVMTSCDIINIFCSQKLKEEEEKEEKMKKATQTGILYNFFNISI